MTTYYNEIDPHAAEWLRSLIADGLIPDGHVDQRSIADVQPGDIKGFTQWHFFAGIGVWAYAGRLAGWPDDKPLLTGSCPCQPFSVAGRGLGEADDRHLWPHLYRLIRAIRPPVAMGEQVSGADGYDWLDGVFSDLEAENYACRALDLTACAVNAPHIRQRLYWIAVGDASGVGRRSRWPESSLRERRNGTACANVSYDNMADANSRGCDGRQAHALRCSEQRAASERADDRGDDIAASMADAMRKRYSRYNNQRLSYEAQLGNSTHSNACDVADAAASGQSEGQLQRPGKGEGTDRKRAPGQFAGSDGGLWHDAEWIVCHDGKARRAQRGIPLLAHGSASRVAAWRGFGNAIVAPLAAEVLAAFLDTEHT